MRGTTLARNATLLMLLFAAPSRAADPYADFRIPDSQGFRWLVDGGFSQSSDFSSLFGTTRGSVYRPRLRNDISGYRDAEATAWNVSLTSDIEWFRAHSRSTRQTFGPTSDEAQDRADSQRLSLIMGQSWYPGSGHWFLNASASVAAEFSEFVRTQDRRDLFFGRDQRSSNATASHDYGERSTWTLGVGAGRVRSVDAVYDAWEVERRLQANGRLRKPLSPEASSRLAQLSYASGGLRFAHERSSKYYWRETERILREDGALAGESLDAYALSRLLEPWFGGRSFARQRGLSVMLSASLDADHGHEDMDFRQDLVVFEADTLLFSSFDRQSQRFRTDRDELLGGMDVSLQRPVGHRWQFGLNSGARYGAGRKRTTRFNSLAQAGWSIADRWSATSSVRHFATSSRQDGVGYPPRWSFSWDNSLGYWLEDAWSVSLSYGLRQDQRRSQGGGFIQSNYSRNSLVGLQLTYRPVGRFTMPELGIAEHLVPGTR